ncbi:MAG: ABC transporter permease [Candidatus Thermoplasmatota archaeon]|jgi:molybdate/tungstate transport system permease protein|nr:ABC transporter permease [Candidatus Thermoplasmatota archaeon]
MRKRKDLLWVFSVVSVAIISIPIVLILIYGLAIYHDRQGYGITVMKAIALTLFTSILAAVLVFIVFTPLAYELSSRVHRGMETIADIPASIPHPIVGIAILILGSPFTPTGKFLESIGIDFFDTIQGMVIALAFVSAPIYIRSMQSALSSRNIFPDLLSQSFGASRIRTLYGAVLPGMLRQVISSMLTSMSRAMSEFGSIAIVAYYVTQYPFNGVSAASVLIYQYYGYFGPGVAITASAIMIIVSLAVLAVARIAGAGRHAGVEA